MPAGLPAPDDDEDSALAERPAAARDHPLLGRAPVGDPRAAVGAHLASSRIAGVPVTGVVENVTMRMALMPIIRCTAFLFGGAPIDHEARVLVRARPGRRDALVGAVSAALARAAADRLVDVRPFDSSSGAHHRIGLGLLRLLGFFGVHGGGHRACWARWRRRRSWWRNARARSGIRRALGATRSDIVSYFLVESAVAAAMGSVIGVVATVALFAVMRQVFHAIRFNFALMLLALATLWIGTSSRR